MLPAVTTAGSLENALEVGQVGDFSAVDSRISSLLGPTYTFRIEESQPPLAPTKGLFVVTPVVGALNYYAVLAERIGLGTDRTLVPGQERQVYECAAAAFEDHWGDGFSSEQSWLHRHVHASDTFDPELWYLAWEGELLVGVLLAAAESEEDRELGYVGWLGVRREARGRGIGEALLRRSFVKFYELGKLGAQLVVDSESSTGANRLYERVGMTAQPRFANWDRALLPAD